MTKPTIVTRAGKGSALTWTEGDTNLTNLRDATISVTDGTNTSVLNLNDTLTLTPGTNMTISVNAATDTVTIGTTATTNTGTVTSVSALTLSTTGTDVSSTVATGTTTPVITLNIPTASATNRGALSSTDWSTFNGKQSALVSGTSIKTVNSTTLLGSGNLAVGTVTSVGGTGTVNGLSLSGTVTTTGSLTLGGTLDLSSPPAIGGTTASTGRFTTITSTIATGTAPFTVASTTNVANLNASSLNGATFAAPGAIGGTTPGAITGTTITANTAFAGALNGTVGATTPNTGSFTTLTASGAYTGTVTTTGNGINITYNPTTGTGAAIQATGKDSQGGVGYFDFLKATNTTAGVTNANKSIRLSSTGDLQIINSAYTTTILSLTDAGALTVPSATVNGVTTVGGASEFRLNNSANTFYVGFKAGAVSANKVWTLPTADGTANQVLKTDGAGTLSWATAGGGAPQIAILYGQASASIAGATSYGTGYLQQQNMTAPNWNVATDTAGNSLYKYDPNSLVTLNASNYGFFKINTAGTYLIEITGPGGWTSDQSGQYTSLIDVTAQIASGNNGSIGRIIMNSNWIHPYIYSGTSSKTQLPDISYVVTAVANNVYSYGILNTGIGSWWGMKILKITKLA